MSGTTQEEPERIGSRAGIRRHPLWLLAVGLAVAALVTVGVVVLGGSSSSSKGAAADQQLASVQRACVDWTSNSAPSLGASSASVACTTMADWMTEQLHSGRMTGSMMWGSATTMGGTCRKWLGTDSRSSIASSAWPSWCDEMVSWMEQHIGNWDGWMMSGHMMGG